MRKLPFVCILSLGLSLISLALAPLEVSAKKVHYDANHVHWRWGENCAYSPFVVGLAVFHYGGLIDIHELYDSRGRTVAVVYYTDSGNKLYQVNPLLSDQDLHRLHLRHGGIGLWSAIEPYDPHVVQLPERECIASHLGGNRGNEFYNERTMLEGYQAGKDFVRTDQNKVDTSSPYFEGYKKDDE